jgi:hypothetical protein
MTTHSCLRCGKRGPRHYRGAWYCDDHVPIAPLHYAGERWHVEPVTVDRGRLAFVIAMLVLLAYLAWAWI